MTCIQKAGYENRVKIALDVASTEFFKEGKYHMEGKAFSSEDLIQPSKSFSAKPSSMLQMGYLAQSST